VWHEASVCGVGQAQDNDYPPPTTHHASSLHQTCPVLVTPAMREARFMTRPRYLREGGAEQSHHRLSMATQIMVPPRQAM
jgi:hypothetical protein